MSVSAVAASKCAAGIGYAGKITPRWPPDSTSSKRMAFSAKYALSRDGRKLISTLRGLDGTGDEAIVVEMIAAQFDPLRVADREVLGRPLNDAPHPVIGLGHAGQMLDLRAGDEFLRPHMRLLVNLQLKLVLVMLGVFHGLQAPR